MSMKMKHWQDPISLLAGLWMVVSPWALAYSGAVNPMRNAVIAGALVAAIAFTALYGAQAWQEWANLLIGAWLIVSPWLLGFGALQVATLNAVVVGVAVTGLALWALGTDRDIGGWFSPAH